MAIQALQSICCDEKFDLLWKHLETKLSAVDVPMSELSCQKRVPRRFEVDEGEPEYPDTAQDYY